jgi:hypothetical protein
MPGRNAIWRTAGVILSLGLPACGTKPEPAPVAVKGHVQYASKKPVTNMILIFHPLDDTRTNKIPSFVLDKEGRFQDNILPGRYKATLANIPAGSGSGPAGGSDVRAGKKGSAGPNPLKRYQDRDQSPWEVVIPGTGTEDLVLTVR